MTARDTASADLAVSLAGDPLAAGLAASVDEVGEDEGGWAPLRRHLPPVHSPVPPRALAAGAQCVLGMRDDLRRVDALLRRDWGARDSLPTASGTAALALALALADERRGGAPVALPAYGCYDLAAAAVAVGRQVVLYDLDADTLGPAPDSFARALETGPACVVAAHLFGLPVDVRALAADVEAAGALLVEDAAQGAGARVRGRRAGALASVAVLSFGRGKGMTGGGGGALVAGDARGEALVRRARGVLRGRASGWGELARAAAQWALARPWLYGVPASIPVLGLGETLYRPPAAPAPMSRAAAGILAAGWERARAEEAVRARNAARLLAAARAAGYRVLAPAPGCVAGWLRLPLVDAGGRARAASQSARRLGIMPGYPRALCDLPGFAAGHLANAGDGFPVARALAASLFTLPTHSLLREDDLRRLEAWLRGR